VSQSAAQETTTTCKQEFYHQNFVNQDSAFVFQSMVPLPGGDMILVASTNYNNIGARGCLIRVQPDGTLVWKKEYIQNSSELFIHAILLRDGNLAVCGAGGTIMKVTTSGVVVWIHRYAYPTMENNASLKITEDDLGNLYTLGIAYKDNLSFQDVIPLRKYSPSGTLVYSKFIWAGGGLSVNDPSDIVIKNGKAYITGFMHNYYFESGIFMRVDCATGTVDWTRLYNHKNYACNFLKILPENNGFVLTGRSALNASDTSVIMRIDMNGTPVSAHDLVFNALRDFEEFALDQNGSLYIFSRYYPYTDFSKSLLLGKISFTDGIDWMKKYSVVSDLSRPLALNIHNGSMYYYGIAFPGLYATYSFLGRTDLQGETDCGSVPFNASWTSTDMSVRDTMLFAFDRQMNEQYTTVSVSDAVVTITDECRKETFCDAFNIVDDQVKTCNPKDTISISFTKNKECVMPVNFEYNEAEIRLVKSSAATAQFLPLVPGDFKIYGVISLDCGELRDSFMVHYQPAPKLSLGKDTAFCRAPLTVIAPPGFAFYQWNTGSTNDSIIVMATGTYSITATDACGKQQTDQIIVSQTPGGVISLGPDRKICIGDSAQFSAPSGFASYVWTASYQIDLINQSKASVTPTTNDTVFVTATTADGCESKGVAAVNVFSPVPVFLGADTSICGNDGMILKAVGDFYEYKWSSGSNSSEIAINVSGEYFVEAKSAGGCVSRDTIDVSVLDAPEINMPGVYSFCNGMPALISPVGDSPEYLWSTGETTKSIVVPKSGEYTLRITGDNGCANSATTFVTIENCYKGIAYPNAFTPNDDGVNDTYKPVIGATFTSYEFTIYNRWGLLVFRTTDVKAAWDGRFSGRQQDAGNYVWKCVYQENGKASHMDKGWVILVR
jgi:gliding motility-associated-like protein